MKMPALFGWLDKIPAWVSLPYPTKGALLRAFKAALSVLIASLLTAATAGTLFPATFSPVIIMVITALLQSIDKFLRETAIEKEANNGE